MLRKANSNEFKYYEKGKSRRNLFIEFVVVNDGCVNRGKRIPYNVGERYTEETARSECLEKGHSKLSVHLTSYLVYTRLEVLKTSRNLVRVPICIYVHIDGANSS